VVSFSACFDELEKIAVIERLIRLGATPIKGTPKLVMKVRSPEELAHLQGSVERGWAKKVTDPTMRLLERGVVKLPGSAQPAARMVAREVARDPFGTLASKAIPIPGASLAYVGLKRGLERVIDRVAPLTSK
jgi:hypothetical protein